MLKAQNPFVFTNKQEKRILDSCYISCFIITKDKRILVSEHCGIINNEIQFYKAGKDYYDANNGADQLLHIHPN